MTEAQSLARSFRETYLLNVTLAVAAKRKGLLKDACDAAEAEVARLIEEAGRRALQGSTTDA